MKGPGFKPLGCEEAAQREVTANGRNDFYLRKIITFKKKETAEGSNG